MGCILFEYFYVRWMRDILVCNTTLSLNPKLHKGPCSKSAGLETKWRFKLASSQELG